LHFRHRFDVDNRPKTPHPRASDADSAANGTQNLPQPPPARAELSTGPQQAGGSGGVEDAAQLRLDTLGAEVARLRDEVAVSRDTVDRLTQILSRVLASPQIPPKEATQQTALPGSSAAAQIQLAALVQALTANVVAQAAALQHPRRYAAGGRSRRQRAAALAKRAAAAHPQPAAQSTLETAASAVTAAAADVEAATAAHAAAVGVTAQQALRSAEVTQAAGGEESGQPSRGPLDNSTLRANADDALAPSVGNVLYAAVLRHGAGEAAARARAPTTAAEVAGKGHTQACGRAPMQLGPMQGFGVAAPAARRPPPPRGARATVDQHRIRRSFESHIPARCLARWQPRKVHPTLAGTAAFRLRAEYSPARQLVAIVTDTLLRDSVDGVDAIPMFKQGYDRGRVDVESASLLNARPVPGAWGVGPRHGDALRVLVTMSSDAAAVELVNARHRLKRLIPGCHIFDVLSAEEKLAHRQLWPLFLSARDEGKKVQFRRARLFVDGVDVRPGVAVF